MGKAQRVLPYALALALLSLIIYLAAGSQLAPWLQSIMTPSPENDQAPAPTVRQLVTERRWSQARAALEKQKLSGALTKSDADLLNQVYVVLAQKEAQQKNYKEALALLSRVSGSGSHSRKAEHLAHRYRQLLGR